MSYIHIENSTSNKKRRIVHNYNINKHKKNSFEAKDLLRGDIPMREDIEISTYYRNFNASNAVNFNLYLFLQFLQHEHLFWTYIYNSLPRFAKTVAPELSVSIFKKIFINNFEDNTLCYFFISKFITYINDRNIYINKDAWNCFPSVILILTNSENITEKFNLEDYWPQLFLDFVSWLKIESP